MKLRFAGDAVRLFSVIHLRYCNIRRLLPNTHLLQLSVKECFTSLIPLLPDTGTVMKRHETIQGVHNLQSPVSLMLLSLV